MAFNYIVKEIEKLSQDEGLNDSEISNMIGCSRATVNRERIKNDIPKANLNNKKDKTYICSGCGKTITIRRKERRRLYGECCSTPSKILVTNSLIG